MDNFVIDGNQYLLQPAWEIRHFLRFNDKQDNFNWKCRHYWGSSENKALNKFRPVWDLSPLPLQYWCNALPTEPISQLEVGHFVNL